ncbi:hypothetical protein [Novosphingobium sp.]|uniref:hypothetical protein n=1 Tax=Novosphingobium sp. TaxID=1874826 RepID=UPI00334181E6
MPGKITLGAPGQPLFVAAFVAVCGALWVAPRVIAPLVPTLAGLGAGAASGWWMAGALGWHPLLAGLIALPVAAGVFQLLANVFLARLGFAVIVAPVGVLAVGRLAFTVFGGWWAWAITLIGTWALGNMLYRFIKRQNGATWQWLTNLVDELRGD